MRTTLLILALATISLCQTQAITEYQERVVLYEDGTWKPLLGQSGKATMSDFEILSVYGLWVNNSFKVIGEVKNNGGLAADVELEIIVRDDSGLIVDRTKHFASGENISPGNSSGFKWWFSDPRSKTVDAKIIRVIVRD